MRCCIVVVAALLIYNSVNVVQAEQNDALQAQCSVSYETGAKQTPLLFGGVYSNCKTGCQPRNDSWSESCNWRSTSNTPLTNKCQLSQTPGIMAALQQLEGGALSHFSPCELHEYLKGRTLWVIGDSMMRNIYYALRCFMTDFWDHSVGECAASPNTALLKEIFQAADTNQTSVMGHHAITDMPGCVHLLAGGRICWVNSVRGEEFAASTPGEPSLLQLLQGKVARKRDIFFINFGRWHFNNCAGLQLDTYRRSLRQLAAFYKSTREHFPNLVYRVTAHDHSPCPKKKTTVWVTPPADLNVNNNTGLNNITAAGTDFGITLPSGSSSSTASTPATAEAVASRVQEDTNAPGSAVVAVAAAASTSGSSSSSTELTQELQQQSTAQQAAAGGAVSQQAKAPKKKTARFGAECVPAHKGNYTLGIGSMLQSEAEKLLGSAGVPMIDNYSMTRQLYGAHIYVDGAGWDCNHWCSPGVPEWEIYTLFKAFKQYNIQPLPPAAVSKAQPQCVPVVIQSPPPEGWMVRPAPDSSSSSSSSSSVGTASQEGLYQEQYEGWYGSDY